MKNDKNSLCWREDIGEIALYVNGKLSTIYGVIGLGYGWSACARPQCFVTRGGRERSELSSSLEFYDHWPPQHLMPLFLVPKLSFSTS